MKVAIVNDVPMAVETLRRAVQTNGRHDVVWIAENGKRAVDQCAENTPDLILMDLIMPVMNGVESTRRIMERTPCPILVVTSSVDGNSSLIFEAMGAGALDVVATPVLYGDGGAGSRELLRKINRISNLSGISQPPVRPGRNYGQSTEPEYRSGKPCLVAIGGSTGGPQALLNILRAIPPDFPAAIVVIQHMDKQFTGGMVNWLNSQVRVEIRLLKDGEFPQPGVVLVPSTNDQVLMKPDKTLGYASGPVENFFHPSVDVFFSSVARHWKGNGIGVILTGMGSDGAEGLLALRQQGYHTIAQDEKTSVVFGMPKAAIKAGGARYILPVDAIGPTINALTAGETESK